MTDDGLAEEARAWVTLLLSGAATEEDARALAGWRMTSPVHEAAFLTAARMHQAARAALTELASERRSSVRAPGLALPRRSFLIGGGIAAAAGLAVVLTRQEVVFGRDVQAFATAKGERRTLEFAEGVQVELNTLSRIVRRDDLGRGGFELMQGEALVSVRSGLQPLHMAAGAATVVAGAGRLSLRNLAGELSAACLEGSARILLEGGEATLAPGQAIQWSARTLGSVTQLTQAATSEWWRGVLVFNNRRLGDVIAELNRYRQGRIVVANPILASRRISGAFYIDRLDQVVEQLRLAYGVRITRMPGDVLIIS